VKSSKRGTDKPQKKGSNEQLNKPQSGQIPVGQIPVVQIPPELIDKLPPELVAVVKQGGVKFTQEVSMSAAMYQGPWPPASILNEYERLFPGWGTRMLELTEKQLNHRHGLEIKQVDRAEHRMDKGQLFSFIVAGLSVFGAVAISVLGPGTWHSTIASLGLVIVGVGGPAVARVLATKFRWPSSKSESPKS